MRWRFVDAVLAFEPWQRIVAVKAGSLEEYSLLERWGESGLTPAVLTLESCLQAARWLTEASSGFARSATPGEISRWKVREGLKPGERLLLEIVAEEAFAERIAFSARLSRLAPEENPREKSRSGKEPDLLFSVNLTPLRDLDVARDRAALWKELLL